MNENNKAIANKEVARNLFKRNKELIIDLIVEKEKFATRFKSSDAAVLKDFKDFMQKKRIAIDIGNSKVTYSFDMFCKNKIEIDGVNVKTSDASRQDVENNINRLLEEESFCNYLNDNLSKISMIKRETSDDQENKPQMSYEESSTQETRRNDVNAQSVNHLNVKPNAKFNIQSDDPLNFTFEVGDQGVALDVKQQKEAVRNYEIDTSDEELDAALDELDEELFKLEARDLLQPDSKLSDQQNKYRKDLDELDRLLAVSPKQEMRNDPTSAPKANHLMTHNIQPKAPTQRNDDYGISDEEELMAFAKEDDIQLPDDEVGKENKKNQEVPNSQESIAVVGKRSKNIDKQQRIMDALSGTNEPKNKLIQSVEKMLKDGEALTELEFKECIARLIQNTGFGIRTSSTAKRLANQLNKDGNKDLRDYLLGEDSKSADAKGLIAKFIPNRPYKSSDQAYFTLEDIESTLMDEIEKDIQSEASSQGNDDYGISDEELTAFAKKHGIQFPDNEVGKENKKNQEMPNSQESMAVAHKSLNDIVNSQTENKQIKQSGNELINKLNDHIKKADSAIKDYVSKVHSNKSTLKKMKKEFTAKYDQNDNKMNEIFKNVDPNKTVASKSPNP
ncbi:hypothetical protein [Cysteiniphilum marinum]|nr:hypothetical protein [Cysteiniphilum marinum]